MHILRPLVKPYTTTLDSVLEAITQVGDIVLLLCAIPFHMTFRMIFPIYDVVWNRWILRKKPSASEEPQKETASPVEEKQEGPSEYGETRTRKRALHNAHIKAFEDEPSPEVSIYATPGAAPEVWHPPPSAYEDSPPNVPAGLPTPPAEDQIDRNQYVDEWRQYEAFPSAWPASPPSTIPGLPSEFPERLPSLGGVLANVAKESQQGFRRSLLLPRESLNPDSDGGLSDDHEERTGVHTDDEMEIDGEYYEEEDDFNVTLRTPYPLSRIRDVSGMTAAFEDGDDSTGLSTIDYDSPLQTRTNSEASVPSPLEDSPSAGRKRRLPSPAHTAKTTRPAMREKTGSQETIRVKAAPTRPSVRAPLVSRKQSSGKSEESSASDPLVKENADDTSIVKKRLVETGLKARPGTVRPMATKIGENKVPPRKMPAASIPRAPVRQTTAKPAPKLATASSKESMKRKLGEKPEEVAQEAPANVVDS